MPRRSANTRRRGAQRQRHANAAAGAEDDTEEVRTLRATYPTQLAMLSELFPTWTDEDLLFVILESNGEVEVAVGRISEGHAEQFSSVKSKKTQRKEAAANSAAALASTQGTESTVPAAAPASTLTQAAPPTTTPTASAAAPTDSSRRSTRGGERASRGRGAPAARAGRGGFRGVARGGAAFASATSAQNETMPVTTTPAAFGAKPKPAETKPRTNAMSWAQIARPQEPPKAPAERGAAPLETPAPKNDTDTAPAVAPPTTETIPVTQTSAPAPAEAPIPAAASTRPARAQRPRQDAAVVMPDGASLDQLDVKFGTLNFMANDSGDAAEPSISSTGSAAGLNVDAKQEAAPVHDFDGFKSSGFGMNGAYGLAGTRPVGQESAAAPAAEEANGPLSYGSGTPGQGYSTSIYGFESNQRTSHPYATGLRSTSDERASQPAAPTGPAGGPVAGGYDVGVMPYMQQPQGPPQLPQHQTQTQQQSQQQPQAQQPFPNMMPYYYPYYMPNQFQHFSPAAGFGQYPLYGAQPQPPSKLDVPAPSLAAYAQHDPMGTPYSTHTPPQPYQAAPSVSMPTYESQGFSQRLGGSGSAGANADFKLQSGTASSDANHSLPGLSFLGGGVPQGAPAAPVRSGSTSSVPAASNPLDYRAFDASNSPATRSVAASGASATATPGVGAAAGMPPPPPQGMPSHQAAPMAQQHPAYYQHYAAGLSQANAYDGYHQYGRQPYWV